MNAIQIPATTVAPQFRAWDEGTTRVDLASRKEVKYTLEHADIGKLRSLLGNKLSPISHNEPVSVVRSVYFDDPTLSACRANLDGLGKRTKVRLRWYDSPQPKKKAYLEVKWRENRITGKHRLHLDSDFDISRFNYRQIRRGLSKCLPPHFLDPFDRYPEPIVIVQYNRQHFLSPDERIRVTLDYGLTFYDQVGKSRFSTSFGKKMDGFVVLEGKAPIGSEWELRHLLHPLSRRASRCSKYVHGCGKIGILRGD